MTLDSWHNKFSFSLPGHNISISKVQVLDPLTSLTNVVVAMLHAHMYVQWLYTHMRDKCLFMSIVAQQQTDDDIICCLSACLTVIWSLATFPDWLLSYPLYSYDIRMKSSMMPIFGCGENKALASPLICANTLLQVQESTSTWRPLVVIAQCVTVLCVLIGLCACSPWLLISVHADLGLCACSPPDYWFNPGNASFFGTNFYPGCHQLFSSFVTLWHNISTSMSASSMHGNGIMLYLLFFCKY